MTKKVKNGQNKLSNLKNKLKQLMMRGLYIWWSLSLKKCKGGVTDMKLSIREIAREIEIREPRYHGVISLMLAKYKVDKPGRHIIVTVLKGKYAGRYYIDTKVANMFPQETNGRILCYVIPMDVFKPYEGRERDI